MIKSSTQATIPQLEREITILEQRLLDGERRIEEAQALEADTTAWEDFWIELLHTYESVSDRLQSLQETEESIAA